MTLPPKSQHRANNTGCFIVKWVITYCSPCVVVKYFYTTLRRRCTIHKTDSQSLHWNDQINIYIIEKGEHLSRPSDLAVLIYQGLLTWEFWFIRDFWLGSSDFFMEKFKQQVIYSFMSAEFRNVAEYIHVYEDFLTWHTSVKQTILTSYSFINISKNIWLLLLKDLNQPLTHKLNS